MAKSQHVARIGNTLVILAAVSATTHRRPGAARANATAPILSKEVEMEMKMPSTLSAAVLAVTLGLGFCIGTVQAQTAPTADHSATAGEAVSDAWITTKVKSELATTKGVKSMDVTVRTTNGVVTLTGVLATKTDVRKAVAAAKSVKGVRDVDASGLKAKD